MRLGVDVEMSIDGKAICVVSIVVPICQFICVVLGNAVSAAISLNKSAELTAGGVSVVVVIANVVETIGSGVVVDVIIDVDTAAVLDVGTVVAAVVDVEVDAGVSAGVGLGVGAMVLLVPPTRFKQLPSKLKLCAA